jgi:electron transport complex protein RnfG
VIAKGYESDIELGISITREGRITGTRILYEDETKGMGDQFHQDKSNWLENFIGKSLSEFSRDQWKVTSDGGMFDEISGATITSRSVLNSIRSTLDYHELSHERIYQGQ